MSVKRSRATYEADLQAQQSPFVIFGTPLPPLDSEVRDDGSFVPVWKQEVRDDRGRKRLHGAFTGGFSAGYFNTVGSKEGWTPSTFVSSRSNRRQNDANSNAQQRPEDFMDEEDLADAEEARHIQTSSGFANLGLTEDEPGFATGLAGLLRTNGDTMGIRLLRKMGWKDGQGIGPKVRRTARLGIGHATNGKSHLFAPDNIAMVKFSKKTNRKGLGYEGESRLTRAGTSTAEDRAGQSDDDDGEDMKRPATFVLGLKKKKEKAAKGGIGFGVLNDTGSDDEDPYEIGPKISYNRVLGGDNKKRKKKEKEASGTKTANPLLKSKPVFMAKKKGTGTGLSTRKCRDGRPPLDGFIFGRDPDSLISEINSEGKYAPPEIPADWKSSKTTSSESAEASAYISTADAAKASTLDPKARAAALGEKQLPGKSVFDFMSSEARDRLAAATGRTDLPEARGEIPEGYAVSEQDKLQQLLSEVPKLDKETAIAAISRGAGGGAPYADDEAKRSRYRAYLENQAGFGASLPSKPFKMSNNDWLREFHEFYNCARIFKPMSGFMASRFTTATTTSKATSGSSGKGDDKDLLVKPPPKPKDPAEEAARMGMYGNLTRKTEDFFPTRLLCKRFIVKPPAHVQPDSDVAGEATSKSTSFSAASYPSYVPQIEYPSSKPAVEPEGVTISAQGVAPSGTTEASVPVVVDASRNEALEGKRAGEQVFRAIFGDSSDDEDDDDE